MPESDAGSVKVPESDAGSVKVPESDAGSVKVPEIDAGSVKVPEIDAGSVKVPEIDAGSVKVPESDAGSVRCLLQSARLGEPLLVLEDYVLDKDVAPNHLGFDFKLLPTDDATVSSLLSFYQRGSCSCCRAMIIYISVS